MMGSQQASEADRVSKRVRIAELLIAKRKRSQVLKDTRFEIRHPANQVARIWGDFLGGNPPLGKQCRSLPLLLHRKHV